MIPVTVARAVELKHNASLISALANETAKLFHESDAALGSIDSKLVGQWRKYLQLKENFYLAYVSWLWNDMTNVTWIWSCHFKILLF